MTVEPVIGEEGVFHVRSRSRSEILHRVDLQYVAEGQRTAKPTCSCEAFQANVLTKGKPCWHIMICVMWECERLGLLKPNLCL